MRWWLFLTGLYLSISNGLLADQQDHFFPFDLCASPIQLDDQTRILLKKLNAENSGTLDEATLKSLQNMPVNIPKKVLPQVKKIVNIDLPGPIGPIRARLYYPCSEGLLPVFVFFHGGGWALGSLDEYDSFCQEICHRTPCMVVSIDYHLAPDHPFPEPLNDCYFATSWIAQHIHQFGGDASRLAIGGDSAGGNLAAAVTLMARDKGTPSIQEQVLIYPAVNDQLDTLSYFLFADGYYLTRDLMQFFWKVYLRQRSDGRHPYASPLQASTLSHLPPALVVIANFDPLRDEGLAYAWRLYKDRVSVIVKRYNTIHGFIHFEELDTALQAIQEIAKHLHHSFCLSKPN
jgi:acetyl esterase